MKYKLRRLAAATILLFLFIAFTTSVLVKTDIIGRALDSEFQRQDAVLEAHWKIHGVEKWKRKKTLHRFTSIK